MLAFIALNTNGQVLLLLSLLKMLPNGWSWSSESSI